jgi:hypothetical protein
MEGSADHDVRTAGGVATAQAQLRRIPFAVAVKADTLIDDDAVPVKLAGTNDCARNGFLTVIALSMWYPAAALNVNVPSTELASSNFVKT